MEKGEFEVQKEKMKLLKEIQAYGISESQQNSLLMKMGLCQAA